MARQEVTCDNSKRLKSPVIHNENAFEHCLSYYRPDGSKVEMALIHVPGQKPTFTTAIFPAGSDPSDAPSSQVDLSMDELRVRLHYVLHLQEAGLLDR